MAERNDTCAYCRFFNGSIGECRKHAPHVFDTSWIDGAERSHAETQTMWPATKTDDWCGDFEAKRGRGE